MKLNEAIAAALSCPVADLPSRLRDGSALTEKVLEKARERVGSDRVEKLLSNLPPVEIPAAIETPGVVEKEIEVTEVIQKLPAAPSRPSDISAICEPFAKLVGMDAAKAIAVDNIHANQKGRVPLISPVILAPAGTGKTAFSLSWMQARENAGANTMAILPCQVRRVGKEWDALINFLVAPGAKTLFVDECHEIFAPGRTVQLAKLGSLCMAALDGNRPDSQEVKLSDEISIGFDRRECQIILATNFPGKMPEALAGKSGRAFRLELPLYSDSEIAEIARLMLVSKGIRGNEESLQSLARVARGSARPLEHLTAALYTRAILASKATVNKEDILAAMITCGLFPLGFSKEEIKCLEALKQASTLSVLSARFPNLDNGTLKSFMAHALGNGLAGKTNGGFILTDKGRRYFVQCGQMGFPVPTL